MKNIKNTLVLLTLSVLFISCDSGGGHPLKVIYKIYDRTPILHELEDKSCDPILPQGQSKFPLSTGYIDYNSAYDSTEKSDTRKYFDLSLLSGLPFLNYSDGITKSFHGTIYENKSSNDFTQRYVEKTNDGQGLSICKKNGNYKKTSLEAAALSTSFSLSSAQRAFNNYKLNAINSSTYPNLPAVTLHTQTIEKYDLNIYRGLTKIKLVGIGTDNAFYFNNSIHFLPHSEEFREQHPHSASFWNIPFIAAHEYGHHIFRHSVLKNIKSSSSSIFQDHHIRRCINTDHITSPIVSSPEDQETEKDNKNKLFISALKSFNEGFSDLFSYYSFLKNESLKNFSKWKLGNSTNNRDLEKPIFGDGTAKILDYNNWNKFVNNERPTKKEAKRGTPNFSDFHIIGAVFAHMTYKMFHLSTTTDSSSRVIKSFQHQDSFNVLMNWLNDLSSIVNKKFDSPEEVILYGINSYIKSLTDYQNTKLSKKQCELLMKIYPYSGFSSLESKHCLY